MYSRPAAERRRPAMDAFGNFSNKKELRMEEHDLA